MKDFTDDYGINFIIDTLTAAGGFPERFIVNGVSTQPEITVNGKKVNLFCTSNYLGLASDPRVKKAVIDGVKEYGLGTCGSRLVSGDLDIHRELEKTIADFKNCEDAIIFSTGTLANMGIVPSVMSPPLVPVLLSMFPNHKKSIARHGESAVFVDKLNHASIFDACKLTNGKIYYYNHSDMNDLSQKIRHSTESYKMIITDGVFSADGDIALLKEIVEIADKHNAIVMVDDAHASGILGPSGRGTCELLNVEDQVDIKMGTLSKAFGGLGGFIVGSRKFTDFLRINARTYLFTGALPGAISAGVIEAINIAKTETWRREQLLANSAYVRESLNDLGFNTLNSETQIIPVLTGDENLTIAIAHSLFEYGIFAPSVRYPVAPKGKARIRLSLMATHEEKHIKKLIQAFTKIKKQYNISPL